MKDALVRGVRQVIPKSGVTILEEAYRRGRVWTVAAKYGFPTRGMRVIAVTGTNGKTTTLNYLNEILKTSGLRTAMFTTAVIEIAGERKINDLNATVALTAQMQSFFREAKQAKVDFVLLETTSHALQQHKLDTVSVECAIMTNLTQDHLDYHGTMENYAAAKAKLFKRRPRLIVLNRDDEWFDYYNRCEAGEAKMTYGTDRTAECRILQANLHKDRSEFTVTIDHQTRLDFMTALAGKFNVYNATAAVTAAYLLQIDLEHIQKGITTLKSIPGRLEHVPVDKPYDVIVDYAHTPDALEKLLESLKSLTKDGRLILVFGATGDRDQGKRPIMGEIAARLADKIIVTDEESYNEDPANIRKMVMQGIKQGKAEVKTEEIADRREAIEKALKIARPKDTIVITGMGHEQFRIENGKRIPWNDGEVVKSILKV